MAAEKADDSYGEPAANPYEKIRLSLFDINMEKARAMNKVSHMCYVYYKTVYTFIILSIILTTMGLATARGCYLHNHKEQGGPMV